jgi:hypothetical protein
MTEIGDTNYAARFLPEDFVDLPDAFTAARTRGMQGQIVQAELENSDADIYGGGVEWHIQSSRQESARVSGALQRPGTVPPGLVLGSLCLDCVNDRQCFLKYNAILPGVRCNQLPVADLRVCRAYWNSGDPRQLSAARSACAHIYSRERDNDNLANVIADMDRRLSESGRR